ncbi:MAG: ABC transporter substrate-binding protein [Dehalococcoidia bacterium]|nr:ABC transporter substrate-binding protein [Dehalococcoidia bacterium]
MKKWFIVAGSVLLVLALVVGCKAPTLAPTTPTPTPVAKGTLKIGVLAPLSGPGLAWGNLMKISSEIAADDINAAGGLKVGNTVYEIKIIPYDDKYAPDPGLAAANRLVYEDKVKYIIGPIASSVILAIQPVTEKEKVMCFGSFFTEKALGPDKPFTWRLLPSPVEFTPPEAAWIAKNFPSLKTVVIVAPNDETGQAQSAATTKSYEKAGVKVLPTQFYDRGTTDFAPIITRVLPLKPDGIETDGSAPGDVATIYNTARTMGYKGMLIRLGGEATAAIVKAAGESVEGMLYHADGDLEAATGQLKDFYAEYDRRAGAGSVAANAIYGYETIRWLTLAMQEAGTVEDTEAVTRALEQMKTFDSLAGKYYWGGKETYGIDRQLLAPCYVGQVVNGKGKILVKLEVSQ